MPVQAPSVDLGTRLVARGGYRASASAKKRVEKSWSRFRSCPTPSTGTNRTAVPRLRCPSGVMVRGQWLSTGTLAERLEAIRASYGAAAALLPPDDVPRDLPLEPGVHGH